MQFTPMAFDPADGLENKEVYDTTPVSEEVARENTQRGMNQLRDFINDSLLPELMNQNAGTSGAESIGSAPIQNVAGQTVHAQVSDVKRQIDEVSAGSLTDGIVTTAKINDGAVTKEKLAASALDWSQVYESAVMNPSGGFTIPSQVGKSEMMIQARNADLSQVIACAIVPLDEAGKIPATRLYGTDPHDFTLVDYRLIQMTNSTTIVYGLSSAESVSTGTYLQRLVLFTR